jgi:hypothetical protein
MSPGAFWGRPGGNTLTNAAVGAPITKGKSEEEIDYFATANAAGNEGEGYFPPLTQTGSSLSHEILHEEPESASGSSERQPSSGRTTSTAENGPDREDVSSNSGSSSRSSANERMGGAGIDGVIERLHSGMHISLPGPGETLRSEEQRYVQGSGESLPRQLGSPPIRRKVLGPVQEQGTRNRSLSFAELVQDAGSQSS